MRKLPDGSYLTYDGLVAQYDAVVAQNLKLRDKLMECAKQCAECHGTGLVTIQYGGDGYGDKCCGLADADDQPCPECEDIREVLE